MGSYVVRTNPQDIFVKFEIWVRPKGNYRELEKMFGRLLDNWVNDLQPSGSKPSAGYSEASQ